MRVSVIIPARNAGPELVECLETLRSGRAGANPDEIFVVDDGSTDATAAEARRHGAVVVALDGRGPAAARNAGAKAASGELLVFFDADCVPQLGCLDALLAPFADPEVVGVRGGYTTRQRSLVARFAQLELEEKQVRLALSDCIALVDTACAAFRRPIFLEQGGFDERFRFASAEDAELSFRLVEQGAKLVYAPGALVRHRHPESLERYCWRKLRFGYYRAQLYGRYPARLREDGYTPRLMPLQIGLTGLAVLAGALSFWLPSARSLAVVIGLAFGATSLPLARAAWRSDRALTLWVPPLLFARSLAQGLGLLAGLLRLATRSLRGADLATPAAALRCSRAGADRS